MLFLRPHSSCNQHANSFFPGSINTGTSLHGDVVNIKDNDIFKSAVRGHIINQV